ncbi:hypothetical protein AAUPMB_07987 [Pasteurella multocida subsp. multocida str. Anand1_buffalo]|nr:hypothetical protein AAUPMB_07987 [Pasteurella multocida subsp. multocida str. Anand1_buffalo]
MTVVEPVDLAAALQQVPDCRWLFTTGGKATNYFELVKGESEHTANESICAI